MRVYLDENLSPVLAHMLRARGVDAVSAHEVGTTGVDDRAQLRQASREGRALVTCDITNFIALAADAIATNTPHAGIVLVSPTFRNDEFGAMVDGLEEIARRYPAGLSGAVLYLTRPRR